MPYFDGFVVPVPEGKKDAYVAMAKKAWAVFQEHGALRMVEAWGDDVPEGKVTDFRRSVQAKEGEVIVFSWIEWPDKEARDAGMKATMQDDRIKPDGEMPFDGQRMVYGGFAAVVDEK